MGDSRDQGPEPPHAAQTRGRPDATTADLPAHRVVWALALAALLAAALLISAGTRPPAGAVAPAAAPSGAEIPQAELLVARARMVLDRPRLPGTDWQTQARPDEDVIELCTRAIALDPEFAPAYDTRAAAYAELGQAVLAQRDRVRAASLRRRAR